MLFVLIDICMNNVAFCALRFANFSYLSAWPACLF